jgi:cell division GTPase FtsZ
MIFGMGTDEKMDSEIRVTIIATGFETNDSYIDMDDTSDEIFQIIDEEKKYAPIDLPPFLRRYVQNI